MLFAIYFNGRLNLRSEDKQQNRIYRCKKIKFSEKKLCEQKSKNMPSKYQFPKSFSQNSPSLCPLLARTLENGLKASSLGFCSTLEDSHH